jgi:hypothetical protein
MNTFEVDALDVVYDFEAKKKCQENYIAVQMSEFRCWKAME